MAAQWAHLLGLLLLLLLAAGTTGAPSEAELLHLRWQRDEAAQRQCFAFSLTQSVARDAFEYPDAETGERKQAKPGELVNLRCDSVVCPNPVVPDCYLNEHVCAEDEWCQLEDQVRFGPWAMADGETPNLQSLECAFYRDNGYDWIFDQVCRNQSHWGPWKPVRGRCTKYRQEQQSCNSLFAALAPPRAGGKGSGGAPEEGPQQQQQQQRRRQQRQPPAAHRLLLELDGAQLGGESRPGSAAAAADALFGLTPHYAVSEKDGRPPTRPLLCAPGLVCTGDVEPMPNTCVKVRPPNVCFQGPWWDSTSWCKVGGKARNRHYGGLPLEELKQTAQALLVQLPVEVFAGPLNPLFWQSKPADVAREHIQAILEALWPERYRGETQFPLELPDPRLAGEPLSAAWNATAAEAAVLYRQANKVWSTIQTLVHNARDPLPPSQVTASRALAVWLRQHFMCCNCRGMWANYVLNNLGLPPASSSRLDHTRWWWRAQNMVSEHAATSRGGHPWVWPSLPDAEFKAAHAQLGGAYLSCQNPWFLPYEFAEVMWKIPDSGAGAR